MKAMHQVRLIFAASVLSFTTLAWACFWDSDTLRTEANGMPGVVEAVTGFFPVYPDEYYQRRIEIAQERLEADPDRLASYDDIAVSHDRLGDSTAAIEAILPKLEVIERLGDDADDHLYRYHANIGTFHVHRWIRGGGDAEDLSDLEAAREHIAKAIEINPDAHFGREFVQLGVIEWLLDPEAGSSGKMLQGTFPTMLAAVVDSVGVEEFWAKVPQNVVDGLVGLVVLGAAQESVDIYFALGIALNIEEHSSLALLCSLRVKELVAGGKTSLHPTAFQGSDAEAIDGDSLIVYLLEQEMDEVTRYYYAARGAAESYRTEHQSFIQTKLSAGLHPDTNAEFFNGEPQRVLPELPNGFFGRVGVDSTYLKIELMILGVVLIGSSGLFVLFWKLRKIIWSGSTAS